MTVIRPLEVAVVNELLERFADNGRVESPTCASEPMKWQQGYITGPWLSLSKLNTPFVTFALALGERTDCQFVDLPHRSPLDATTLRLELDKHRSAKPGL
jgi:hypothetical protein